MEIAQIILSIITAITAIVAIFMTRTEIKAQNNQCLFEKRLANYIACRKLLNLTSENLELLKFENSEDGPLEVTTVFSMITNCGFLEEGSQIIYNTNDYKIKKSFLKSIESIETMAEKSKLLFSDETGEKMKAYLISFKDALMAMYKYEVLLQLMLKNNKSTAFRKSFDELAPNLQRRLREQTIQVYLIKAGTPDNVKNSIFESVKSISADLFIVTKNGKYGIINKLGEDI